MILEGYTPVEEVLKQEGKFAKKEQKRLEKQKKEKYKAMWREVREYISQDEDPVIQARKAELLSGFDFRQFITGIDEDDFESLEANPMAFRGHVFEELVSREMNNEEENSVLANFILKCLKNPGMLGLRKGSLRNPDHLGVVVDIQTGEATITGMYEVKVGKNFDERAQDQIRRFYGNLELVTERLNAALQQIKETYSLDFIPEGGIKLLAEEDIDKFVVVPRASKENDIPSAAGKAKYLNDQGWGMRHSVFSSQDMLGITRFMSQYYQENREIIDADRAKVIEKKLGKEKEIARRSRTIKGTMK